ncbi:DUF3221 domain-containing protein [Bacillus horti]|uniref:DUF3221 domain-containing protein n=1 Tax=Caldalkalibacillus horti TaxID=77523 RepID=A0ABT9VUE9_9BACI|nr:DUF3221 domain-containing protein [Bacillus horti]MDQ0164462.1 hypothetical protein [Bacillus horti]
MKKITMGFVLIVLFLSGCSEDFPGQGMTSKGYIVDKEEQRILVMTDITEDEMNSMSVNDLLVERRQAVWIDVPKDLSPAIESLNIGDKVSVLHGNVDDSYPLQTTAIEIEIVER